MSVFMNQLKRKTAAGALCLALAAALCGCEKTADEEIIPPTDNGTGAVMLKDYYENYDAEPYAVRTILKEYSAVNPDTGTGFYGRYTELKAEGKVPDTFRAALEAVNRRAEKAVLAHAEQYREEAVSYGQPADGYRFITYGYIAAVTRADHTAFSILETEFEKRPGQGDSEVAYRFRGTSCDTQTGEEIVLSDLAGEEESCQAMLKEAVASKYGVEDLASATLSDCAWTMDALGLRFYFNSDAVSHEKRTSIGDYTGRAVSAALTYDSLSGARTEAYSSAPESYIAMLDREKEYALPHGNQSILLTQLEDSFVIRIQDENGKSENLIIEYADDQSEYYIIRSQNGFYLFRQRTGYQEGFFYDFSMPDGGFGRFAYNTSQYFDSFMREIQLALPYNPECVHMAEVRRSFGESRFDRSSFVPNGHYAFPNDPKARYKRFFLTDKGLAVDSANTAIRLLEDFTAVQIDDEGREMGEITVPAGKTMYFDSLEGEAARYDDPPKRSHAHTYIYHCLLNDGTHIRFQSDTESPVSSAGAYLTRFTEPVSLAEARNEEVPQAPEAFTVQIGGKEYPLIPDYSLTGHSGEEIDFGSDLWWQAEGYPGRYVCTDEDFADMKDSYFTQEALAHPDERAELTISEDGSAVFKFCGQVFTGTLPEKRYYRTDVSIFMESQKERRSFRIMLREGDDHSQPVKIEFFSEGLPATNEPSKQPPLSVYMTHVSD